MKKKVTFYKKECLKEYEKPVSILIGEKEIYIELAEK